MDSISHGLGVSSLCILPQCASQHRICLASRLATHKDWIRRTSSYRSKARIVCADDSKEDAARKALEAAFSEKKNVFKKWDEEIKSREAEKSGSGGSGSGGRGWAGGDGDDDSEGVNESWEEAIQVFLAVTGLVTLYCFLTMGKGFFAFILNMILFALRGFKRKRRQLIHDPGMAASRVTQKWGSD